MLNRVLLRETCHVRWDGGAGFQKGLKGVERVLGRQTRVSAGEGKMVKVEE